MERSIIHLNIADFAAAVETNDAPCLNGYPIIIAPTGAPRAGSLLSLLSPGIRCPATIPYAGLPGNETSPLWPIVWALPMCAP